MHVVVFEHADRRLQDVVACADERAAASLFAEWAARETTDGEPGHTTPARPDEPDGTKEVWRGEFGSRVFRLALEIRPGEGA